MNISSFPLCCCISDYTCFHPLHIRRYLKETKTKMNKTTCSTITRQYVFMDYYLFTLITEVIKDVLTLLKLKVIPHICIAHPYCA